MSIKWLARPYKYADGVPWNDDRYEIFVIGEDRELISVGGAIRNWKNETIAFLCTKGANRHIRTPLQAEQETEGLYVRGSNLKDALMTLKWKYPDPVKTLSEAVALANANF